MHFSTTTLVPTLLAGLCLLSSSAARIVGLRAPSTIAIGQQFEFALLTENYIQTVYDVGYAIGIQPGAGYPQELGYNILKSGSLAKLSNIAVPLNFTTSIPNSWNLKEGSYTLTASVMSLYGVLNSPTLASWNVTLELGTETSVTTVSSHPE